MWNSGWRPQRRETGYLWINILDLLLPLLSVGQTGWKGNFSVASQSFLVFLLFLWNPATRHGLLRNGPSCCRWINTQKRTNYIIHALPRLISPFLVYFILLYFSTFSILFSYSSSTSNNTPAELDLFSSSRTINSAHFHQIKLPFHPHFYFFKIKTTSAKQSADEKHFQHLWRKRLGQKSIRLSISFSWLDDQLSISKAVVERRKRDLLLLICRLSYFAML